MVIVKNFVKQHRLNAANVDWNTKKKNVTQIPLNASIAKEHTDKECPERNRQDRIRFDMAFNKSSYFEAQKKFPKKSKSVNSRLNSLREFPNLPNTIDDTPESNTSLHREMSKGITFSNVVQTNPFINKTKHKIQPNKFPTAEQYEEVPHIFEPNPYRTSEIEKLKCQIKKEIVEQFNLMGIVQKIHAVQQTILNSTKKTDTIEQDLLLINISNQLDSIINPEIFNDVETESPSNPNDGSC
jgi:hypothetical protein